MYMHYNHCHRATAHLLLNILLLLFIFLLYIIIIIYLVARDGVSHAVSRWIRSNYEDLV
jgi:hypothetical protein